MKNFKNSCLIILAFIFSLSFVKNIYAGEWVADGEKWKYSEEGSFVTGDWRELDGSIYYFDTEGHMATELIKIGKFYYMFYETGRPFSRNEDFFFKKRSYSIGARGKVMGLETDMNDTEYFQFIIELRAKRAEEAAKKAYEQQFASPDQVPEGFVAETTETRELTEQEKRLAAAEEYKKVEAEKQAAAAEAERMRILSAEYRASLAAAAMQGNDEAQATESLMNEFIKQTTTTKNNLVTAVANIMATNPGALSLESIIEDYGKTVSAYKDEIDADCRIIKDRLGLTNTRFVLMKEKFTQVLDKELDSLRTQIMGLIK